MSESGTFVLVWLSGVLMGLSITTMYFADAVSEETLIAAHLGYYDSTTAKFNLIELPERNKNE